MDNLGDLIPTYLGKNAKPKHAIALVGGGIDGFLAAHSLLENYPSIKKLTLLFFDYGQSSKDIELSMVLRQEIYFNEPSPRANFQATTVVLEDPLGRFMRTADAALCAESLYVLSLDKRIELPKDAHDPCYKKAIEDIKIYIPNRNARFMVQAFGLAELHEADVITLGAVGNVNMDNSLAFIKAACDLQRVSGERTIAIYAPFVLMSKSMVAYYADQHGLNSFNAINENVLRDMTVSCFFPIEIQITNTSERREVAHCGQCRSCLTLKQGFKFADAYDPYRYSNR